MDAKTLYTIMFMEDLFIVLFALIYIRQYQLTRKTLIIFATARMLQGIMWFIYAQSPENAVYVFTARSALSFGIALESYSLITASKGFDNRKLLLLCAIAALTVVIDLFTYDNPQIQTGLGNLLTSFLLFYAWWHLSIGARRTLIQRLTGWLIFFRAFLILLGALIIDMLLYEFKQELTASFNSIVASVTIFSPLLLLFILKEQDDQMLQQRQRQIVERNQELKGLIATREKFFSIIAHDLRGPLGSIIGLLEVMNDEVRDKDYSNVDEYAKLLQQSAYQNYSLLNNLLQWSRVQTNRIDFKPERQALQPLLQNLQSLFQSSMRDKRLDLRVEVPDGLHARMDAFMIDTVARNLVSNAIKFTPEGGRITVSAWDEDGDCWIQVEDTGVGIPDEQINNLFRIETNISTTGTNQESGTGLGLVLCREFVDIHGGTIRAERVPGEGTRFVFHLPGASAE